MSGDYAASFLPWILIPTIGWFFPIVVMGLAFFYVEKEGTES